MVEDSCGCVFCDIGLLPERRDDGVCGHFVDYIVGKNYESHEPQFIRCDAGPWRDDLNL